MNARIRSSLRWMGRRRMGGAPRQHVPSGHGVEADCRQRVYPLSTVYIAPDTGSGAGIDLRRTNIQTRDCRSAAFHQAPTEFLDRHDLQAPPAAPILKLWQPVSFPLQRS